MSRNLSRHRWIEGITGIMWFLLLFGASASAAQSAEMAQSPLYNGLPSEIPAAYLEREGFVPFAPPPDGFGPMVTPIGSRITLDGQLISPVDRSRIGELFSDSFLARVPSGMAIRINKDSAGREIWDYPEGTEVVHRVGIRAPGPGVPELYELRIIRKLPDLTWAFGVYSPANASTLRLNTNTDASMPLQRDFIAHKPSGVAVSVSVKRINLNSCRNCHAANSPSNYQYETLERVGPCGFVPDNPHLKGDWASRYARERGERPFGPQ